MNYNNPYFYSIPSTFQPQKIGLLQKIFGKTGVSIENFLNGTQRVLNFTNQAIPLVKQVKPIIGNAKTMFKVMNEFKKNEKTIILNNNKETPETEKINNTNIKFNNNNNSDGPTFFI